MIRQRQIITYEDVQFDEVLGFSRAPTGAYFRGEGFEPVADPREVARAYFDAGQRIPPEFPEVRNILATLIA